MTLIVDVQTIPLKADLDGVMRVGDTRVTPDTVVRVFEQGHTVKEIVNHYPAFRLANVYAAIAANKVPGIRAALCGDAQTAKGACWWNNANTLLTKYILDLAQINAPDFTSG